MLLGDADEGTICHVAADGTSPSPVAKARPHWLGLPSSPSPRQRPRTSSNSRGLTAPSGWTRNRRTLASPLGIQHGGGLPAVGPGRAKGCRAWAAADRGGGRGIATGLRSSARELLAYLALRPDGATGEAIVEALWPDHPPDPDNTRLHTALKRPIPVAQQPEPGTPCSPRTLLRGGPPPCRATGTPPSAALHWSGRSLSASPATEGPPVSRRGVLLFHVEAWTGLMPPKRRTPPGRSAGHFPGSSRGTTTRPRF